MQYIPAKCLVFVFVQLYSTSSSGEDTEVERNSKDVDTGYLSNQELWLFIYNNININM